MIDVRQTAEFSGWLRRLKNANAVARIVARIRRMEHGNPGDTRSVGKGVMEMRIDREHFPPKWTPVRRRKCDQAKKPAPAIASTSCTVERRS